MKHEERLQQQQWLWQKWHKTRSKKKKGKVEQGSGTPQVCYKKHDTQRRAPGERRKVYEIYEQITNF